MLRLSTWVLAAFWPAMLSAAVIRGNVVENQTGKPLARAVVTLQPVQGTPGGAQTVRTDSYGAFTFSSLAAGAYVVAVSKMGFLPVEYKAIRQREALEEATAAEKYRFNLASYRYRHRNDPQNKAA